MNRALLGRPVADQQRARAGGGVRFAATLQLLLAVTFLIAPAVAHLYGAEAQAGAEAEIERQGFPARVLAENRVTFTSGAVVGRALPVAIALVLAALAVLNLRGSRIGRIATFVFQPLVLLAGGTVLAGQVFAVQFVESTFAKSGDVTLERIDVRSVMSAAMEAFPAWLPINVWTRFVLATLGSLLVLVLLASRSASPVRD